MRLHLYGQRQDYLYRRRHPQRQKEMVKYMGFMDYLLIALDCVLVAGLLALVVGGVLLGTYMQVMDERNESHESAKRRNPAG